MPIPLAATGVKIGEDVCAMGFPGVMGQNITLTLTKGVVSTVPGPDDEEGFIGTDCKVNPGNSGGPLCNFSGSIAGMVTAQEPHQLQGGQLRAGDSGGPRAEVPRGEASARQPEIAAPVAAARQNLKPSELAEMVAPRSSISRTCRK